MVTDGFAEHAVHFRSSRITISGPDCMKYHFPIPQPDIVIKPGFDGGFKYLSNFCIWNDQFAFSFIG